MRLEDAVPVSGMMTAAVSRWVASWPVPFTPEMAVERITNARKAATDAGTSHQKACRAEMLARRKAALDPA